MSPTESWGPRGALGEARRAWAGLKGEGPSGWGLGSEETGWPC